MMHFFYPFSKRVLIDLFSLHLLTVICKCVPCFCHTSYKSVIVSSASVMPCEDRKFVIYWST